MEEQNPVQSSTQTTPLIPQPIITPIPSPIPQSPPAPPAESKPKSSKLIIALLIVFLIALLIAIGSATMFFLSINSISNQKAHTQSVTAPTLPPGQTPTPILIPNSISTCSVMWETFPQNITPYTDYTISIARDVTSYPWNDVSVYKDPNDSTVREDGLTGDADGHPSNIYTLIFNSGAPGTHNLYFFNNDFVGYGQTSGTGPKTLCSPVRTFITNDLSEISPQASPSSYPLFMEAAGKPVIYLYPTRTENVTVRLDFNGTITDSYPLFDNSIQGWQVEAFPDGHIINYQDGKRYNYLFWEGLLNQPIDMSQGFVVEGKDTLKFLQEKLETIGLNQKEYDEFIVYWLPKMQHNKYNFIKFVQGEYFKNEKLTITPKPDSMLRVFMAYKPLDKKIDVKAQNLTSSNRKGFAVVEWGGTEISGKLIQ